MKKPEFDDHCKVDLNTIVLSEHIALLASFVNLYFFIFSESKLKIKTPEQGSCLYICQHCLVHLGDIGEKYVIL